MMNKTFSRKNAINAIHALLKEVNYSVYHERVPSGAEFPYFVYNVGLATEREGLKNNFNLEINVWDNKGANINDLETLTENITEKLYKQICFFENFSLRFGEADVLPVQDPDENIRRRNININVNYYNK
jgi:hypothetical protein